MSVDNHFQSEGVPTPQQVPLTIGREQQSCEVNGSKPEIPVLALRHRLHHQDQILHSRRWIFLFNFRRAYDPGKNANVDRKAFAAVANGSKDVGGETRAAAGLALNSGGDSRFRPE